MPRDQSLRARPSARFPSVRNFPGGSKTVGIFYLEKACLRASLRAERRERVPPFFTQLGHEYLDHQQEAFHKSTCGGGDDTSVFRGGDRRQFGGSRHLEPSLGMNMEEH